MLPSTAWTHPSSVVRKPRNIAGIRVCHEERIIWFAEIERPGCPITIGRDASCDICLSHESVSRIHCQIQRSPNGALTIEDRESLFGIKIYPLGPNDVSHMVEWAPLTLGSHIKLGAVVLVIVDSGGKSPFVPERQSQWKRDADALYGTRQALERPSEGITMTRSVMRRRRLRDLRLPATQR